MRGNHQSHGMDKMAINSAAFLKIYKKFKGDIRKTAILEFDKKAKEINKKEILTFEETKKKFREAVEKSKVCFKKLLLETDYEKKIRLELEDFKYLNWLVAHKFWEPNAPSSS